MSLIKKPIKRILAKTFMIQIYVLVEAEVGQEAEVWVMEGKTVLEADFKCKSRPFVFK
jgi:hypothetical protein